MDGQRRLAWRFYAHRATLSEGFVYPVINLFLLSRDVGAAGVGLAHAAFFAGLVVGEVPTGYVADRIGRRDALLVSTAGVTATMLAFVPARGLPAFLAVFALWGVAVTFRSGSSDAWLYDLLAERYDEAAFTRIRGRGSSAFLLTSAVGSLAGGYLYEVDHVLPFLAAAALTGSGLLVLATFPKNARYADGGTGAGAAAAGVLAEPLTVSRALAVVREQFATPPLRAFVAYTALLYAVPEFVDLVVQPVAVAQGVPVGRLGWLYAGFLLVAAGAAAAADRVMATLGLAGWFRLAPLLTGLALVVPLAAPALAIPGFFVMRAVRSTTGPLRSQVLNDHVQSVGRATVLSVASMVYGVAAIVSRAGGGALWDATSPLAAMAAYGGLLVAGSLALWAWERPVPRTGG